jgi:choline dehydrogenase-like flavoprotein
MLLDAIGPDRNRLTQTFDACVIGTGPAGITLARQLASHGLDVALMEGGGLSFTGESQDLYLGENVGIVYDPLDVPRLRYFGGSSNHWGGRCRVLDASDFESHPYLPLSGWPFGKAELDRYAVETDAILDLPPAAAVPDEPIAQAEERFVGMRFRRSEPVTRFGLKYEDELAASDRITVVLNANLVDLRLDETGRTVTAARFRTLEEGDPGFTVTARAYALCAGGIENPRLLLNFRSQIPVGIGNEHDLVGRYFCEHPHFRIGEILYERPIPEAEAADRFLAPTPEYLARHGSVNFALHIEPRVQAPLSLAAELVRSIPCAASFTERLAEQVLGRPLYCEARGLGAYRAQAEGRQAWWADVRITAEQTLLPDSRVMLAEERDALGLQRPRLDWRLSELDFASQRTAVYELGAHYIEQGLGRVRLRDWLAVDSPVVPDKDEGHRIGGHHHMCSTRMSNDPREGVVDRNCRVHSVSNLYIGGSSVFATPGHANPTYTIVQLALRLGDHIAERSDGRPDGLTGGERPHGGLHFT